MQNFISPSIRAPRPGMPSAESSTPIADNGLEQDWCGETVFCNPPYGRAIYDWVFKCWREFRKSGTTVVLLIPVRTDTRYCHKFTVQFFCFDRDSPFRIFCTFAPEFDTMFYKNPTYNFCSSPKATIWGDEHPFAQII